MPPEISDDLLGGTWQCDLDSDDESGAMDIQELVDDLIASLQEG